MLKLTKTYSLDDGKIIEDGYCKAKHFEHAVYHVKNISDLFVLLKEFSRGQHSCLIRGIPTGCLPQSVQRNGVNFPMPEGGKNWVCQDFDGIALPSGMDPYSREAIEYAVHLLPPEFHSASYIAQFSASAGVLNDDGTPYWWTFSVACCCGATTTSWPAR